MQAKRRTSSSSPSRAGAKPPAPAAPFLAADYARQSMRPLHIFLFILPLVIFYELGTFWYLGSGTGGYQTIKARRLVGDLFEMFGVAGVYLPAAALLTTLLVWHILSNDRWRVKPWVLVWMVLESILWALPLIVLSAMLARATSGGLHNAAFSPSASHAGSLLASLAAQSPPDGEALRQLPWRARVTVSVGAGLYEEMLFRLVGVALLHFLLRDIGKLRDGVASTIAVVGAAVAFALYHQIYLPSGEFDWPGTLSRTAAGLYLGMLYVLRGFGVVVGAHAVYDVLALVLLTG